MKILSYIIPTPLQTNDFIKSLAQQAEEKGKLSEKQENALRDIIGVEEDFFLWDVPCSDEDIGVIHDFNELKSKLKRNRFRKTGARNACVRALNSILEGKPNFQYIDKALGRDYVLYNYRR